MTDELAIAAVLLEPSSSRMERIRRPTWSVSATQLTVLQAEKQIFAVTSSASPRTYSLTTNGAFILIIDSGSASIHRLHIIFFNISQAKRVRSELQAFLSWSLDSAKSGAHWYRLSTLKSFLRDLEFYVDESGDIIDIAMPQSWSLSGADAIFRTQKTRLGGRRMPICLQAADEPNHHEASRSGGSLSSEDGWMNSIKLHQRIAKAIDIVPSVRDLFQPLGGGS